MKKTIAKFSFIFCILSILLSSCILNNSSTNSNTSQNDSFENDSNAEIFLTDDWARHYQDEFILYNNVWGKGSITNYKQAVYQDSSDILCPFGWKWDWPNISDGRVKAYPEIYFGTSPFNTPATNTTKLPAAIQDITTFKAEYNIEAVKSGRYNLAFEFWLNSNISPNENNITAEVMIWMDCNDWQGFPPLIETVTLDGEDYNFYKGSVDTGPWNYICFLKVVPEYTGETNFKLFIDYLITNNHINPDDYVSCLDLGNEIIYGKGETRFLDFSITLN